MTTFYLQTSVSGSNVTISIYATAASQNDKVESFDLTLPLTSSDTQSNLTAAAGNAQGYATNFAHNGTQITVPITTPVPLGDTSSTPFTITVGGFDSGNSPIGDIGSGTTPAGLIASFTVALNSSTSSLTGSVNFQDYSTFDGTSYSSGIPSLPLSVTACFAEGTRIATPDGGRAVELLEPGMRVTLARGGSAEIVWVGHETIDTGSHPYAIHAQPVRISAHAFGSGQPSRDLRLSPDHAVFWNGVLVPVRYLINGATVVQETVQTITYYHVELAQHDVLLAEGLPAETFLDTGNRGAFENSDRVTLIHPELAMQVWKHHGFAPLDVRGEALEAIRQHLTERARSFGWQMTMAHDLRVMVQGRQLPARATTTGIDVALPAGTGEVRILSRNAVPAQIIPGSHDHRRLGAAITGLALDGQDLDLATVRAGGGWHVAEPGLRWTSGCAELDVSGASRLHVAASPIMHYWVPPKEVTRAIA